MVIDRIEGNCIICEHNGAFIEIDRSSLPEDAAEGDVIGTSENGRLYIDKEATQKRREHIQSLMKKLFT